MGTALVREMRSADLDDILRINTATAPRAILWTREMYAETLAPASASRVLVAENAAEDAGVVIGFLCYRVVRNEIQVANLAVDPRQQRKGVGSALLESVWARHPGADEMTLDVRESNAGARAFYRRLGFAEERRRRDFYQNPQEDAILLVRKRPESEESP
jgi:[ribosomal protein S18]-alanine N-acetyltransferase